MPTTPPQREPEQHTVHCLRDIQVCIDGGYGVMNRQDGAEEWELVYTLDAEGNRLALELLQQTSKRNNFLVTVQGDFDGSTARVASIMEYEGPTGGASPAASAPVAVERRAGEAELFGHFIFMIAAWGCVLPWGVALANRARNVDGVEGDAWFVAHRKLQSVGWVLQLVGFAMAVAYAERVMSHFNSAHTIIGVVVTALGTLQPLNALVRPHAPAPGAVKSGARVAWEWLHKGLGYAATVGGVINVILGIDLVVALNYDDAVVVTAAVLFVLGLAPVVAFLLGAKTDAGQSAARGCLVATGAPRADTKVVSTAGA